MDAAIRRSSREEGSALLLALLVLAALSILATTAVVTSMGERNLSRYESGSVQALGVAETGVAYAKRAIVDRTVTMTDADSDGRPDFELTDSLAWGGTYHVMAEASDIKGLGITAYQSNGFAIVSEGEYRGARRRVKVEIVHDSFLKFARFVSATSVTYGCSAVLSGEVYTGGDIDVPSSCAAGKQCQFLESAFAVGDIPNAAHHTFHRGYVTDADTIDLSNSFNWTDMRSKAKGTAVGGSACERRGSVGIWINLNTVDPLRLQDQAAPNTGVLLLERFDFHNATLDAPDTVITYRRDDGSLIPVLNTVTGLHLRASAFNGIVFFENDAKVKGTPDGVSARNLTIFATRYIIIRGDIITGRTGFDPVTRAPDNSGDPVNIGLVAESYVQIDKTVNHILRIDAALLSRTQTWGWGAQGSKSTATYPTGASAAQTPPLDLDLDNIHGENPKNNDPGTGEGWNELTITAATWVLNISGPIITVGSGDAYPWSDGGIIGAAAGPTRRYNYDMDMTEFPPPCFPVPLNLYKDVSWTEVFEVRTPLASCLPN
jgi:predicted RNA-binding protein with TRAM domain